MNNKNVKTTDWLIRGISPEQLEQEKIEALKKQIECLEAELEVCNEALDNSIKLNNDLQAEIKQLAKDKENLAISYASAVVRNLTIKDETYKEIEEKIDKITWYHINQNGELVIGANSETDIPLYKAEDVHSLLKELVGE